MAESFIWISAVLALLALLALGGWLVHRATARKAAPEEVLLPPSLPAASENSEPPDMPLKVSYAPSGITWSGSSGSALPLKTLTYKQYECLEDGRYGFRVVPVKPSDKGKPQPHKTRAHGVKTVMSLVQHGFLVPEKDNAYVITDRGLNALEVCNVRY